MSKLYIKQKLLKLTDHYPILDENQNEVYFVDQDYTFIGARFYLKNMESGQVIKIEKVPFALMPKYEIYFPDGKYAYMVQDFVFFKKNVSIYLEDKSLYLKGEVFNFDFKILDGDRVLATIERFFTLRDTYEINILEEEYRDLVVASLIVIDNLIDRDKK